MASGLTTIQFDRAVRAATTLTRRIVRRNHEHDQMLGRDLLEATVIKEMRCLNRLGHSGRVGILVFLAAERLQRTWRHAGEGDWRVEGKRGCKRLLSVTAISDCSSKIRA